jgi:uridine kinase
MSMKKIVFYCENTSEYYECEPGTELYDIVEQVNHKCKYKVLGAFVDNQLKELSFKVYLPHSIKFIDFTYNDGRRMYIRSLCFVLQKSVVDLFPEYSLFLDYTLPNGIYGELRKKGADEDGTPKEVKLQNADIQRIKNRMNYYISNDYHFIKNKMSRDDASMLFRKNGREAKAELIGLTGRFFVSVYFLDGYADTYYGPLLYSTRYLDLFDLISYNGGFCLQSPSSSEPWKVADYRYQDKLSSVFHENSDWNFILGVNGIATINKAISDGHSVPIIQVAEALHERKYADIADQIKSHGKKIKIVLIAGPSSSGKTTTSKRIAIQCKTIGLNPVVIAMDNYFVNREFTPVDSDGEYDFEALNAVDLPFLNKQLNALFEGQEVEIPKFDFIKGERFFDGTKIKMGEKDILIMEGIHALNKEVTREIDPEKVFRIYASALTSLSIDENNLISTTDSRLLRRMVRDFNNRGISPEDTILRWASVRRGEERNIFPFQENADAMFNSTMIFELPLLKYYAEPLLRRISPSSEAFTESIRLLKFLSYVVALAPTEIQTIPPTSVMREFIGGSSFEY